jgi:hypothetical protein
MSHGATANSWRYPALVVESLIKKIRTISVNSAIYSESTSAYSLKSGISPHKAVFLTDSMSTLIYLHTSTRAASILAKRAPLSLYLITWAYALSTKSHVGQEHGYNALITFNKVIAAHFIRLSGYAIYNGGHFVPGTDTEDIMGSR